MLNLNFIKTIFTKFLILYREDKIMKFNILTITLLMTVLATAINVDACGCNARVTTERSSNMARSGSSKITGTEEVVVVSAPTEVVEMKPEVTVMAEKEDLKMPDMPTKATDMMAGKEDLVIPDMPTVGIMNTDADMKKSAPEIVTTEETTIIEIPKVETTEKEDLSAV